MQARKTLWMVLGVGATGAALTARYLLRRRDLAEAARSAAIASGIADVDPAPLTNPAAEGIDVDATEAAHSELRDLRERLPRRGENVR